MTGNDDMAADGPEHRDASSWLVVGGSRELSGTEGEVARGKGSPEYVEGDESRQVRRLS
jgi:hypothetical protein